MTRDNPFEDLFKLGTEENHWTEQMIQDFMERGFDTADFERDGYRKEVVNGEVTEYHLEDGEWVEVSEEEEDVSFNIMETMSGQKLVADLGGEISPEATTMNMSFNNGVLEVEFEYEN